MIIVYCDAIIYSYSAISVTPVSFQFSQGKIGFARRPEILERAAARSEQMDVEHPGTQLFHQWLRE